MSQQQTPIPTLNGTELTDIDSVAEAYSYLAKDYNEGDLDWAEGGDVLQLYSRYRSRFEHTTVLMEAVQHPDSSVWISGISASSHPNRDERKVKIELRDQE